jgi:hypothetical protein
MDQSQNEPIENCASIIDYKNNTHIEGLLYIFIWVLNIA